MNYYKRHLGDYAKDAGHLTLAEHGAFTLLLDRYYSVERPITSAEAYKVCRARTAQERELVDAVLGEFFMLADAGWTNKRADAEIAAYRAKADRNRENGHKGGRPKRVGIDSEPSGNPDGFQDETEPEPKRNLSHEPLATSQYSQEASTADAVEVAGKPAPPACPHSDIVSLYHDVLPELPRVREWSPDRQAFLRSRWRDDPKRQNLDWWRRFFGYVRKCPFLMGQVPPKPGSAPFTADLEWLIRPQNFRKVIEGRYEARAEAA